MKGIVGTKLFKRTIIAIAIASLTLLFSLNTLASARGTDPKENLGMNTAVTNTAPSSDGFSVIKAGATGTDNSDDTQAIQKALNDHNSVYIPDGTYYINVDKALHLKSGQTLTLSAGATLQALPTSSIYYRIIDIKGVTGVTVTGGRLIGDRTVHTGTSGEWGMGIAVECGSKDVTISNIYISNCWGDGVFIGDGTDPVSNVKLENVTCDNNRRQGLTITNAMYVTVTGCTFKNTNGTAPEAGIDIEPDAGYTVSDITIANTQCTGNAGSGIDLMGIAEQVRNITITGSLLSGNSGAGLRIYNAGTVQVTDTVASKNNMGIDITRDASNIKFSGVTVTDNQFRGVSLVTCGQAVGCSNILFEASIFSNNSTGWPNESDGVRVDRWDSSGYIKDVVFRDCQFYDNQVNKTQAYGLTVGFTSGGMSGIVLEKSCTFSGNIAGDYLGGKELTIA